MHIFKQSGYDCKSVKKAINAAWEKAVYLLNVGFWLYVCWKRQEKSVKKLRDLFHRYPSSTRTHNYNNERNERRQKRDEK